MIPKFRGLFILDTSQFFYRRFFCELYVYKEFLALEGRGKEDSSSRQKLWLISEKARRTLYESLFKA